LGKSVQTAYKSRAASWGSQLVNIGVGGHIATGDGFGEWQQGKELLRQLIQYEV
jgi:hypothetical protein